MNFDNLNWNSTSSSGKQFISFKEYGDNMLKFLNEGDEFYGIFMFWQQDYNTYKKSVTRKYFFKAIMPYHSEGEVYNPTTNKMQISVVDVKVGDIACFEQDERTSNFELKSFHKKMAPVQAGHITKIKFDRKYNNSKVYEINFANPMDEEAITLSNEVKASIENYRKEYTLDRVIRMGIVPREKKFMDNGVEKTVMTSFINLAEHTLPINEYYEAVYGAKKIINSEVVEVDGEQTDYTPTSQDNVEIVTEDDGEEVMMPMIAEDTSINIEDIPLGDLPKTASTSAGTCTTGPLPTIATPPMQAPTQSTLNNVTTEEKPF